MVGAILKAFTFQNNGGNLAGVIILNEEIEKYEKQKIASKLGLSETVFIKQVNDNYYESSFFTPICEINLCGHATIASFYYMALLGLIKGNDTVIVYQKTNAGILEVELCFNNNNVDYVYMQLAKPIINREVSDDEKYYLAKSLNIDVLNIGLENINPVIASAGVKDILIPVKSREILNSLNINTEMIKNISVSLEAIGFHVFAIEGEKIFARNFAPAVGIKEECATGTSNGTLAYLLYQKKIINEQAEIIQGESMNETSQIIVKLKTKNKVDIRVGGKASLIKILTL